MELLMLNIISFGYTVVSLYQIFKYKDKMAIGAVHHLLTHLYIALLATGAVNLYAYNGCVSGLLFVALYILQHISKENLRLIRTNRWTDSVEREKNAVTE